MTDEYEILDAEDENRPSETNDIVDMAVEMYESFGEKLARYGLSDTMEISDEDGDKLAMAMFHGGQELEDCLEYISRKYGAKRIGEERDAGLE